MDNCILCGSKNYEKLYKVKGCQLVKCKECSLVVTEGDFSFQYHKYHGDEAYKVFEGLFKNIYQKRVNMVLGFKKKPGKVLDIGASTGTMLQIFKDNGWEVWGVEPSKSAELAKAKGIKIFQTTFEKSNLPKNYFDVVTLNHTLEHMGNPVSVLRKARKLLKKKAIVFIDVPNIESLSARILGKKWPFILPEEHIFHFTPQTLKKVLQKSGFKVKFWKTQSGLFECAKPFSEIFLSLSTFKKRFFTNVLGFPWAFFATIMNKGSSLSMIGEK